MITAFSGLPGWLAENPPPAQGPEFGGSSPIGLVVTLVLLVVLIFLIRSMNGHLRKLPKSFDPPPEETEGKAEDGAARPVADPGAGGTGPKDQPNGSEVRTPPAS
ncbi:MAG TPA: hypothetical protein VGH89_35155 [Pseudonocardia sp.]